MKTAIYKGKSKTIYTTEDTKTLIAEFNDSITAFNSMKKDSIPDKGSINRDISFILFNYLSKHAINTHLINKEDKSKLKVLKLDIIPIEVVIRNITAGSICKRYNINEGMELKPTIIEYFLKNDELNDPLITDSIIHSLNLVKNKEDLTIIKEISTRTNEILTKLFNSINLKLVDLKLEFGYDLENKIVLADELSPDNMRLWDTKTNKPMDKDIFRNDLGNIIEAYNEVLNRLKTIKEPEIKTNNYKAILHIKTRKNVLDPQGVAIQNALKDLGYDEIENIKTGKYIEIELNTKSQTEAWSIIDKACKELLANPVIEDYTIKVL
ncbi:MAG: phosphoribosylaminoimidazolesuccinocarboxamide synthase [Vampirovibrionia bacterium]